MEYLIKGKLENGQAFSGYSAEAYDDDRFFLEGLGRDDPLGKDYIKEDGSFKIEFRRSDFKKFGELAEGEEPDIYLKVKDENDNVVYKSDKIIVQPKQEIKNKEFEIVVVGSGFGGSVLALSWINKLASTGEQKKLCILERGQWWVSHEMPEQNFWIDENDSKFKKLSLRARLLHDGLPFRTWAYPDNARGMLQLVKSVRLIDRNGLYDYRASGNVHVLAASGVGGGSLVYSNVTERPDKVIFDNWKSKLGLELDDAVLDKYFEAAKAFIGVNKITTNAPLSTFKLARTSVFQHAAEQISKKLDQPGSPIKVTNSTYTQDGKTKYDFDADLSITDIPQDKKLQSIFKDMTDHKDPNDGSKKLPPYQALLANLGYTNGILLNPELKEKLVDFFMKYNAETNACERQGRCNLGCIPGARHTLNKQIYEAIKKNGKYVEVRPLCEAYDIEPVPSGGKTKYKIHYFNYWQESEAIDIGNNNVKIRLTVSKEISEGKEEQILCNYLFVAAGSIGSTELLLKSESTKRDTGQKLAPSKRLGQKFSTNGDLLGVINKTKENVATGRGPIVTSVIKFQEKNPQDPQNPFVYTIEDSGLPKMVEGLVPALFNNSKLFGQNNDELKMLNELKKQFINQAMIGAGDLLDLFTPFLQGLKDVSSLRIPSTAPDDPLSDMMLLSGMGNDDSSGEISLKEKWNNDSVSSVQIKFDLANQKKLFEKMIQTMKEMAKDIGVNVDANFDTPMYDEDHPEKSSTVVLHPLGGCPMGKNGNVGVVDSNGQVYDSSTGDPEKKYDNLYVVDGAILPTSIGVNSSLTIAAVAMRIASITTGDNISDPKFLPIIGVNLGQGIKYLPKL